jgi:long-chain acyl-CoA synthetase
MSFGYLPWERLRMSADELCVRDDNAELTYAEFDVWIAAFAGQLAERGFGHGDVLPSCCPTGWSISWPCSPPGASVVRSP